MAKTKEMWFPVARKYTTCAMNGTPSSTYYIKDIYEISTLGNIRNKNTHKLIKIRENGRVTLRASYGPHASMTRLQFSVSRIFHNTFNYNLGPEERVKFVRYIDTVVF